MGCSQKLLDDLCAAREYGDYLVVERPHFFVGLVGLDLAFHWPLCLVNLAGILGSKPWFLTTCLVYGVSLVTSMAAILPELMWSSKASDNLLMVYSPFFGFGVLAMLRGLLPRHRKTPSAAGGSKPFISKEKEGLRYKMKVSATSRSMSFFPFHLQTRNFVSLYRHYLTWIGMDSDYTEMIDLFVFLGASGNKEVCYFLF
ncbi:hypothetical protein MLD38_029278 [Melastoma candidum]|uniref:Uncharacterized protein n=1 Tax=Melastoma candidum TaxID=119954 RepID=A0ACB9N4E1_9MYRT|nr:hypothetical protein MLD38_029278 [Melastoma candidum]